MRITALSVALAAAAAIYLFIGPVYSRSDGIRTTHASLLEVNGPWAVIPVVCPVLAAALPLIFRKRAARLVVAILLCGFVFVAGFSIGLFYLPAALASLAACVTPLRTRLD